MSAAVMKLQPLTAAMEFTPKSVLRAESRASSIGSSASKETYRRGSTKQMTAVPGLSVIEIEALLRDKIKYNHGDMLKAFEMYDKDGQKCVTEGEFRRVLETFCFSMTTEQFQAIKNKVPRTSKDEIRFEEFIKKFLGRDVLRTTDPLLANSEAVEKMVKEKIAMNWKGVVRALQMYDYNRDSHVQRSDLKKVLESVASCRLSEEQFDRFYRIFDLQRRGVINYKDMFRHLGFPTNGVLQPENSNNNNAKPAMKIETTPTHKSTVFPRPKDELEGWTLDQIEVQFRQKMIANFADLKRMFLAFDKKLTGFVSVGQLRSILCQFTLNMNDETFHKVMERCSVKASSQIAWERFLDKFQPTYSSSNGQTIPIKPAHRFNPIKGSEETRTLGEFVKLLDTHINNAHGSFKKAFLDIDKKRVGFITSKELRRIIKGFQIQLTEGQFRELMSLLDPDNSGKIGYLHFLDLFEPRENLRDGHKWLTSVHRYNDQQKPAVLAWDTIEELLQQKLETHWVEFTQAVTRYDAHGTGWMNGKHLRKILEIFCLPLSDEHFQAMTDGMRNEKGQVFYPMLMKGLGVNPQPGDTEGLSTQIYKNSQHEKARHMADQAQREVELVANAHNRTKLMSADEVMVRLQDRITQHQIEFRKAFNKFDLSRKGRVTRKDFRRLLESFSYYMDDAQFKELCELLKFKNHMSYTEFVINFEDMGAYPASYAQKPNNHIVFPIRGDQIGMTALQVEAKLRNKLRQNFEDLRGAFYKFDEHHRGYLTRSSFRRMLDSFMCIMSDEEFETLCLKLGLTKESKVSYKDFLDAFEIRDTAEGHKWLNSTHRYNECPVTRLMTAEEVHSVLAKKIHQTYNDVSQGFTLFSDKDTGKMTRDHFRRLLYNMVIPVSRPEFNKLWGSYDRERKGYLTHSDFLQVVGEQFAPGDGAGTSLQIIKGSVDWLARHHTEQQIKHHVNTLNQAKQTTLMTVDDILQQLKDQIREQYKGFKSAFNKFDRRQRGELTVTDFQRMLVDVHFLLDDEQLYDLLQRVGYSGTKKTLTYEEFLIVFEEGRGDSYAKPRPDVLHPSLKPTVEGGGEGAEARLREAVSVKYDVLLKAFQAFDPDQTGYIKGGDFRQVLNNFVFKLSDTQYKAISSSLPVQGDGYVFYRAFLANYNQGSTDARQWLLANQQPEDNGLALLSLDELQEKLKSLVTSNFHDVAKAFGEADYAGIGVMSFDDFKEILRQFDFFLTAEQFLNLWNIQKVNEFGNLEYHEFLRKYAGDRVAERAPSRAGSTRPITSHSWRQGGGGRTSRSCMSRSVTSLNGLARPYTPLVNAEEAESRLHTVLVKYWREMEKICREFDPQHTGTIDPMQFTDLLSRLKISADDEDVDKLLVKYDLNNNGMFSYREFLKNVALSRSQPKLLPARQRSSLGQLEMHSSVESRLAKCIRDNWKSIWRQVKSQDPHGSGRIVTEELREILRQHQLNCTEEEFYSVLQKYEKGGDSVDFNIFIKDFLK